MLNTEHNMGKPPHPVTFPLHCVAHRGCPLGYFCTKNKSFLYPGSWVGASHLYHDISVHTNVFLRTLN